jgi:hypothetical protein
MKKLCLILPFIMAASAFGEDPIETPPAGSPLRRAILDGFRASKPMQKLSQGWHAKVVFTEVDIRRSSDWAWVTAVPTSEKDSTNKVEPNSAVMRKSKGQWAMVELVSDSIAEAEDPHKEFLSWRSEFMKKHPQCPAAIFPPQDEKAAAYEYNHARP